jgi:Na+-driven multidrug efflux pump
MGNYLASLLVLLPPTILPLITLEQLGATASGYAYIALMLGSVLPSPGLALASSAFAEGANNPADIRQILIKAFLAGGLVTLILAGIAFLGAQWILWVYGADYARESTALLRWLALASPLIVINQLYFTYLRLSKRIPGLVARCLLNTGIILLSVIFLIDRLGIIANGIGVLAGNIAVSITLLGEFSTILRLENMGKQEGII